MAQYGYTERDLKDATKFRDGVHKEALKIIRKRYPEIEEVRDCNPVESYFKYVWDYPGAWYLYVTIPERYKTRDELIRDIVDRTIKYYTSRE